VHTLTQSGVVRGRVKLLLLLAEGSPRAVP
jgi:hypothetical protein